MEYPTYLKSLISIWCMKNIMHMKSRQIKMKAKGLPHPRPDKVELNNSNLNNVLLIAELLHQIWTIWMQNDK